MDKTQLSAEKRASIYFWKLLGKPAQHETKLGQWIVPMRDLFGRGHLNVDEMGTFLKWAVVSNAYSRKYLLVANDPMATLTKNFDGLLSRFRVEHEPVDPDPLFRKEKVWIGDGEHAMVTRLCRKPKTRAERCTLLVDLFGATGRANRTYVRALAQCDECRQRGYINVKTHPELRGLYWMEHLEICKCVQKEEPL